MATPGPANPETVAAKVKTLINTQLKQILKKEGLLVSGAKATLQSRIIERLYHYARETDIDGFNRLRSLVYNPTAETSELSPSPATNRVYQNHAPLPPMNFRPSSFGSNVSSTEAPANGYGSGPRLPQFKTSPFYSLLEPLTPVMECKVRETTRDTVEASINLRSHAAESLSSDENIRALIYCGVDAMSPFSRIDIEFPHQIEIKVNQDEVKANLKGLKNRQGTTRPADITSLLRCKAGYNNHMVVTYALTKKKYFMIVNLARRHSVEELVAKLKSGKTIPKERVLQEMVTKAQDAEIVATSTILSLKCPLSTLRIEIPCRSSLCRHNQCFDASSFLQLQEQAPTWTCPVCNQSVSFEHLHVDRYVDEILMNTPATVDQVTVEPDGKWSLTSTRESTPPKTANEHSNGDWDGDLVEISDMPRAAAVKQEVPRASGLLESSSIGLGQSLDSPGPSISNNKRTAGQVVDLTLSSDEDEEPPRSTKRQASNKSNSGFTRSAGWENMPLRPNSASNANGMLLSPTSYEHPPQLA